MQFVCHYATNDLVTSSIRFNRVFAIKQNQKVLFEFVFFLSSDSHLSGESTSFTNRDFDRNAVSESELPATGEALHMNIAEKALNSVYLSQVQAHRTEKC